MFFTRAYTYNRSFVFFAVTSVTKTMQQVVFQSKINDSKTSFILYLRLLAKTTRCFGENDTLFWEKRHVVLGKTTRCFSENDTLFWENDTLFWGIMGGLKKDFPTILLWICFSEDYAITVTLVTAKKQKLL